MQQNIVIKELMIVLEHPELSETLKTRVNEIINYPDQNNYILRQIAPPLLQFIVERPELSTKVSLLLKKLSQNTVFAHKNLDNETYSELKLMINDASWHTPNELKNLEHQFSNINHRTGVFSQFVLMLQTLPYIRHNVREYVRKTIQKATNEQHTANLIQKLMPKEALENTSNIDTSSVDSLAKGLILVNSGDIKPTQNINALEAWRASWARLIAYTWKNWFDEGEMEFIKLCPEYYLRNFGFDPSELPFQTHIRVVIDKGDEITYVNGDKITMKIPNSENYSEVQLPDLDVVPGYQTGENYMAGLTSLQIQFEEYRLKHPEKSLTKTQFLKDQGFLSNGNPNEIEPLDNGWDVPENWDYLVGLLVVPIPPLKINRSKPTSQSAHTSL